MRSNPVGWFEIYVADIDRAKAFYQTVLETTFTEIPAGFPMWSFPGDPSTYGTPGSLVQHPAVAPGANSVVVYFSCDDCAVEAARVNAAGGTLVQEKFSIGQFGFVALARDTEGNMIGLHSMV